MKAMIPMLSVLLAFAAANAQDNPRLIPFNSDAGTGLSSEKVYTHAVDFGSGGGGVVVNGVAFYSTTAATMEDNDPRIAPRTGGWENFPPDGHGGGGMDHIATDANAYPQLRALLNDFNFNRREGTMRVTGLTPGLVYEVRFINRVRVNFFA